ncbi:hypothetical protein [Paenibacillus antibioticophila]|nr:hypothetical protein [Paenibacillus antibioticophila]
MIQITLLLWSLLSPWAGGTPDMPVPAASPDMQLETFSTFEGISLADGLEDVTAKLGEADSAVRDPYTGFTEYRYGNLVVGMYEESIYYISRDKRPDEIVLNGIAIPLKEFWLRYYLGEPDFIAEDGDVYIRGYSALKLFRDDSGSIIAADLFDDTVS